MNILKIYIEKFWYQQHKSIIMVIICWILYPFSYCFQIIVKWRKKILTKHADRLPVPVVIVGNINIGGSGKTRFVLLLAQELIKINHPVGIIMRGYGGNHQQPKLVTLQDNYKVVGDESLIYAQANIPVVIAKNRNLAAIYLFKQHPEIKTIIADDGLQHYKLNRDFEFCIVDANRMFGNGCLLPTGPLREPISRLKTVDAVLMQVQDDNLTSKEQLSLSQLKQLNENLYIQYFEFIHLFNPVTKQKLSSIKDIVVETNFYKTAITHIISALGDNQRFVNYVKSTLQPVNYFIHSFSDHYHYQLSDLPQDGIIITSEKDYVKMKHFNKDNIWILQIGLKVNNLNNIITKILKLRK